MLSRKSSTAALSRSIQIYHNGFETAVDHSVFCRNWFVEDTITLMEKTLAKIENPGKGCVYHVYELPRLVGFKTDL